MRNFNHVLVKAALQLYLMGLIFSSCHSSIWKLFSIQASVRIQVITQIFDEWSACILALEGHSEGVNDVVFYPNGSRVASGSADQTVQVWDVAIGKKLLCMEVSQPRQTQCSGPRRSGGL